MLPMIIKKPNYSFSASLHAILAIVFFAQLHSAQQLQTCVTTRYPVAVGDQIAGTVFTVVDSDSNANLAVGGYTQSTTMCGAASQTQAAFISFVSSFIGFQWHQCLLSSGALSIYQSVEALSFNFNQSMILAVLDKPAQTTPFLFVILSSTDGSVLGQYSETIGSQTGASLISPKSLFVDSFDAVHFALTLYDRFTYMKIPLISFMADPTLNKAIFKFQASSSSACSNAFSVVSPKPDGKMLFISGELQDASSCHTGLVSKWSTDTLPPKPDWLLSPNNAFGERIKLAFMDYFKAISPSTIDYLWGCGSFNTGTDTYFYVQRSQYDGANNLNFVSSSVLDRVSLTVPSQCFGIQADKGASGTAWALAQLSAKPVLVKVDFANPTVSGDMLADRYSDFQLKSTFFRSDRTFYMVGMASNIVLDTNSDQQWSFKQGIVHRGIADMSTTLTDEAINPPKAFNALASTTFISDQNYFQITTPGGYFIQANNNDASNAFASNAIVSAGDLVPEVWHLGSKTPQLSGVTGASPTTTKTYDIYLDLATTRQIPTTVQITDDGSSSNFCASTSPLIKFSCSVTPATTDIACGADTHLITWTSGIAAMSNPYQIAMTYTITGFSPSSPFSPPVTNWLDVTNLCSSTPLVEPVPVFTLSFQNYTITEAEQSYTANDFSFTQAGCPPITYALFYQNGTEILATSQLFTFDSLSKLMTVGPSLNNDFAKEYSLRIVATIASIPPNTKVYDFTYFVKHECYLAQLASSSPIVNHFTYLRDKDLWDPQNINLAWQHTKSADLCGVFTYTSGANAGPLFTLNLVQTALFVDTSISAGAYTLDVVGTIMSQSSDAYLNVTIPYTLEVFDCSASVITPNILSAVDYDIYTQKTVPLFLNLWSETVGGFTNKCGPIDFSYSFLPVNSEAGIISFTSINSEVNMVIETSDVLLSGTTINVTVSGTLPTGQRNQSSFNITFSDVCSAATITVETEAPGQAAMMGVTKFLILPSFKSSIPLCGGWNFREPTIQTGIIPATLTLGDLNNPFQWDALSNSLSVTPSAQIHLDQSPYSISVSANQGTYSGQTQVLSQFLLYITPSGTCTVQTLAPNPLDLESDSTTTMARQYYYIGDDPLVIDLHPFIQDQVCSLPLDYSLRLASGAPLPDYVEPKLTSQGGTISVYTLTRPIATESSILLDIYVTAQLEDKLAILQPEGHLMILVEVSGNTVEQTQGSFGGVSQAPISSTISPSIPGKIPPIINKGGGPNIPGPPGKDNPLPGDPKQGQKSDNKKQAQLLKASIKSISSSGVVLITFNQRVYLPNSGIDADSLHISLKLGRPNAPEASQIKILSWEVHSQTLNSLSMQLTFEEPKYISRVSESPDTLVITILASDFFVTMQGEALTKGMTMSKYIPKQLSQDAATKALQQMSEPTQTTANSLVITNLAVNIVMASSLQYLWGMLSVMQLIMNMPLMNLQFPAQVITLFTQTQNVASINLLPMDEIRASLFSFTENEPAMQFQQMGIDGTSFIENMGSMLFYVVIYIVLLGLLGLMRFFTESSKMIAKLYDSCAKILLFNTAIRIFIEGQLEFSINSFLNLQNLQWETKSDTMSSISAMVFASIQLVFPFALWGLLWSKFGTLLQSDMNHSYGSSYFEIKTSSRAALLYNVFFMLRRVVYAGCAIFLADYPSLQAFILIVQSLTHLGYIIYVKPFLDGTLNLMEVFNECCILLASYHNLIFSDGLPTDSASEIINFQYQAGWSLIALVSCNMAVNMGMMLYQTFKQIKQKIKILLELIKRKTIANNPDRVIKLRPEVNNFVRVEDYFPRVVSTQDFIPFNAQNEPNQEKETLYRKRNTSMVKFLPS